MGNFLAYFAVRAALCAGVALTALGLAHAQAAAAPENAPSSASPELRALFLQPDVAAIRALLPPPPAPGSHAEASELVAVLALQASRSAADSQLAEDDAKRGPVEWAAYTLGRRYRVDSLPLTNALLRDLHDNARLIVRAANKANAFRLRPWAVSDLVVPSLSGELQARNQFLSAKPASTASQIATVPPGPSSYPSARGLASRLWAQLLADLLPSARAELFTAAEHTASLRLLGGAHFASDVYGAVVLADAMWLQIANDGLFKQRMAAARAEMAEFQKASLSALAPSQGRIFNAPAAPMADYLASVLAAPTVFTQDTVRSEAWVMTLAQSQRSALGLAAALKQDPLTFWTFTTDTLGSWATAQRLPVLEALLLQVRSEFEPVLQAARARYPRPRPAQLVAALTPGWQSSPNTSYPSAKVWLFRIQANLIAELAPQHKAKLEAAFQQMTAARVVGGAHWPSDVHAATDAALRMSREVIASGLFTAQRQQLAAELEQAAKVGKP